VLSRKRRRRHLLAGLALVVALGAVLAPARTAGQVIVGDTERPRAEAAAPVPVERPDRREPSGRRQRRPDRPAPPATAPGADREPSHGNPDPFVSLGARSPFCRRAGLGSRPGCRIAGSIAHTYPVSNYGLDVQIETRIDKVENNLFAAIQSVGALLWLGLVYALKGVLLLLEWAFSLDLLNEAMGSVRGALEQLHERVLGTPWFMAAIAIAGLWGIWRGLVQRQTIQTATGLAATVALMLCALVVIRDPAGTVGHASRLANEASLGFISAAASGTVDRPERSFARSSERLFDALVLRPWCALQFADVRWCTATRKEGFSNADLWLAFPADGEQRAALYKLTKGEDPDSGGVFDDLGDLVGGVLSHGPGPLTGVLLSLQAGGDGSGGLPDEVKELVREDESKVALQEKGGTFTRVALLCLVAIGLLGAVCLLLYLAIKLVLAGLLALLLLLLAPAMLLAPAFGDAGREAFVSWAKRLVGAIAAKLVYALLLALVVVAAGALAALPVGWFGTWLLQIAFWWGVLLKRDELTGFLSVGQHEGERRGPSTLLRTYQNARAARAVTVGAGAAAAALPIFAGRRAMAARQDRAEGRRRAVALSATDRLDRSAERARTIELSEAERTLELRRDLLRSRDAINRKLAPYEAHLAEATAGGKPPRPPNQDERALFAVRERLDRRLDSDEQRQAQAVTREAERAQAREGRPISQAELAAWRERRRRDIDQSLPASDSRNLRAAGIDPRDHAKAGPAERDRLERRSVEAIERDRALLAAVPREERRSPLPGDVARAAVRVDREELRARGREERATWRHEREVRRRRAHLYRR
jgi:hypothetical protein